MGIDPASIVVLDQSMNTSDEVRNLSTLFGKEPFLLVTSASSHEARHAAVRAHRRAPDPGPHVPSAPATAIGILGNLVPRRSATSTITEAAIHEYIGILAARGGRRLKTAYTAPKFVFSGVRR